MKRMQYKRNEDSPVSRFEPWLELDLEQLAWNLEEIRKYTGSRPVSVELTGNAFGHGLIEIAVALAEMGVVEIVVHESRERAVLDALQLKGVAITRIRIGQPVKRGETVLIGAPLFGLEMFRGNLLKPVYTLKTRVLMIKKIPAGAEIGWNNEKKIAKDTLFAALPIGYYDGYPPDANGKVDVLIHGRRYPVSGFISADHTTVDITGTTDIEIGDEVVLVGKQGCEEITHRELSLVSGRGVVEQAMRLYPRLPRLVKHKKGSGYYRYDYSEPGITADDGEPWIELNKKSLNKNLEIVSRQVKHKPILAVVKCNAYGHGLLEISRALIEKGIRHLAVVKPREALTLRENNIQTMILNLGSFSVLEAAELVKQNISQSVFTHRVALLSEA
ncbi:MAG: hypothetical protein GY757_34315, partial [bacterium]|nr:hypothetical protein [bacterium]